MQQIYDEKSQDHNEWTNQIQLLSLVSELRGKHKALNYPPERNHVAELSRQAPDLIGWEIQVHQVL